MPPKGKDVSINEQTNVRKSSLYVISARLSLRHLCTAQVRANRLALTSKHQPTEPHPQSADTLHPAAPPYQRGSKSAHAQTFDLSIPPPRRGWMPFAANGARGEGWKVEGGARAAALVLLSACAGLPPKSWRQSWLWRLDEEEQQVRPASQKKKKELQGEGEREPGVSGPREGSVAGRFWGTLRTSEPS